MKMFNYDANYRTLQAYSIYTLLAFMIMLPLLAPGFILTLDLVFTPTMPLPSTVTSSYPFHALLHGLHALFVPADVIEKLLLLAILLLSAIGLHRLLASLHNTTIPTLGIYIASMFYMMNPFTYSRFMAGQYAVLLGYALLPWLARGFIQFGRKPSMRSGLTAGTLTTVVGMVSLHTLVPVGIMLLAAIGVGIWRQARRLSLYIRYGLLGLGAFLLLSSYWIVPLAIGKGATAQTISGFSSADTQAFATVGDTPLARIGNSLRLQGFWPEGRNLYLLPQDRTVLWGTAMLALLAPTIYGAVRRWPKQPEAVVLFGGSAMVALVVASGLLGNWPAHIGLREPHKVIGLVALGYGVFLAPGIDALLAKFRVFSFSFVLAATALLLLPFSATKVMLWGFDGQLTPRQYPSGWFSANQRLQQDHDTFSVVFLPWHLYMHFQFAGRIIANPAPGFFAPPPYVSNDPEIGRAAGISHGDTQAAISKRVQTATEQTDLGQQLATLNVKYILLAKDADYQRYHYLESQPHLQLVGDYGSIQLFQNTAWRVP